MIKIIIVILLLVGLTGHYIPIKTDISGQPPGSLLPTNVVEKKYRAISGGYSDFKKNTEAILCSGFSCDDTVQKLYLW